MYNSHLQYYKIDFSFSIKLQKIKLYVCEEYKTEREARRPNRAMRMCLQSGQIFFYYKNLEKI